MQFGVSRLTLTMTHAFKSEDKTDINIFIRILSLFMHLHYFLGRYRPNTINTCWLYVNLFKIMRSDHISGRFIGKRGHYVLLCIQELTGYCLPPMSIRQCSQCSFIWALLVMGRTWQSADVPKTLTLIMY